MKIALCQMHVVPGQPEKNLATIEHFIAKAKLAGVDLLVFPELCISGYMLSDAFLCPSFVAEMHSYNEQLRIASTGIAIAFGNLYLDDNIKQRLGSDAHRPNKDGRRRMYNAVCVAQDGQWATRANGDTTLPAGVQPKTLLPNYRFFDDQRYFFSLADVAMDMGKSIAQLAQPYLIRVGDRSIPVGFQVCEDLWCKDYRQDGKPLNISRHLIENGAASLVNISASPWTHHKHDARDRRINFLAQDVNEHSAHQFVPFYYVNNVGAQNNGKNIMAFDGGTTVYNGDGLPVKRCNTPFQSQLLLVEHGQLPESGIARGEPSAIEQKYHAIQASLLALRDMLGMSEHPKFVVGVSGGIDSAVVICLLAKAFGSDAVWALNMPTQFNSTATQSVASHLATKLQCRYLQVPIQQLSDDQMAIFAELDPVLEPPEWMRNLSDENIQAKIRGTSILSNLAGRYGRFFTNNGNKLETALGYATLYGDVGGVVAPIGDLTKAEVFEMARFINREVFGDEVIPTVLLPNELFEFGADDIPPTAELRAAQVDPMKFGYHCALLEQFTSFAKISSEDVLQWYLEGTMERNLGISHALLCRWGIDQPAVFVADLEWFANNIQRNVYKRIQSPPIVITSPSAYGFDIRESQMPWRLSPNYRKLKAAVLQMPRYTQLGN